MPEASLRVVGLSGDKANPTHLIGKSRIAAGQMVLPCRFASSLSKVF